MELYLPYPDRLIFPADSVELRCNSPPITRLKADKITLSLIKGGLSRYASSRKLADNNFPNLK